MNMNYFNTLSTLDKIRINYGIKNLKSSFYDAGKKDKIKAVNLINNKGLRFYSLFNLIPEIEKLNISKELNSRNKIAFKICSKVSKKEKWGSNKEFLSSGNNEKIYSVLEWMLKTGANDDGSDNEFAEVLDSAASLLARTGRYKNVLPIIVDMIFRRNRKDLFIHDLVWAFFRCKDPYTLRLIANYLKSPNQKDHDLACKLLNYKPPKRTGRNMNNQMQFSSYIHWLKENYPFLYFTGESLLSTTEPTSYKVDLDAKYLCKKISPDNGKPLTPLTEKERSRLKYFNTLSKDGKSLLSNFSNKIHNSNIHSWEKLMQYPIDKQVNTAKNGMGGIL